MSTSQRFQLGRSFGTFASFTALLLVAAALNLGQLCAPPPPPAVQGLEPENRRTAFKSQCALNVIECTTSWPTAIARVEAGPDQTVTPTDDGFLVEGSDGDGTELVRLVGSDSIAGDGATEITYSWSFGAEDDDPTTLAPGEVFSTEADPEQFMQAGFHYIRLTVRNDIIRDQIFSNDGELLFEDTPSFDFVELEIEVRD